MMARSCAPAVLAAALVACATAAEWFPVSSTGMEYMYESDAPTDYAGAKAACAEYGDDASVASPTNQEAADVIYNLQPSSGAMFQTRYLGLVNQNTKCKNVPPTFEWDSGRAYVEAGSARWQVGEPSQWRCKEKCVVTGASRRVDWQNGRWNDVKCNQKFGYVCQRPFKTKVHELQVISLTHVCPGIKPVRDGLEQCLKTTMDTSCEYDSIAVRKIGNGVVVSALVREANPDQTKVDRNGATPMQETCIVSLSAALVQCTDDCPQVEPSFQPFTTCADGIKNGFEEGADCGGNDCRKCTQDELLSRGPQGASTGGDPHYVVGLTHGINLCYDVHGTPGDILNLVSGPNLLVNSLVISAPGVVSGTYHGAIGFVATQPNTPPGRKVGKDVLTVMSDGTVRFNNEMILASVASSHSGVEMDVAFVAGKQVTMTMRSTGAKFLVTFISGSRGNAHLDLAVLNQAGLQGTQGIIGQFVQADASLSPKDDRASILTVNDRSVEVVARTMPEIAGAHAECFKYMDLQASGLLAGAVEDYRVAGIYEAPRKFNLFAALRTEAGGIVDDFVKETVKVERAKAASTAAKMHAALEKLGAPTDNVGSIEEARNTLITVASKKHGVAVEIFQALSNEDLASRAERM